MPCFPINSAPCSGTVHLLDGSAAKKNVTWMQWGLMTIVNDLIFMDVQEALLLQL